MKASNIKGALLEYIVRKLLTNCHFTSVIPDGHYIFKSGDSGLFFINGKGAAHDADVLMDPPFQLLFSYPTRILFECKAYNKSIGLDTIRNALGLRYDINDFEIISDESIKRRKENNREIYAISDRIRYNYQVGIASIEHFTTSASEFAANNKIALLSLRRFLPDAICNLFHYIDDIYILSINEKVKELYTFLKDKSPDSESRHNEVLIYLENDAIIGKILKKFNFILENCFVAVNEAGDLLFLFGLGENTNCDHQNEYKARFKYSVSKPDEWEMELQNGTLCGNSKFVFFAPERVMRYWQKFSYDKTKALSMKSEFFSRIFVFPNKNIINSIPFIIVKLDEEWLAKQI